MNQAKMNSIPVALPPIAEQHRIVAKVDELMALCDRLQAARAEREAARDRLAAATLARLNALDPETFADDAHFALDALRSLIARPDQVKQLRETILNLAVRGKLAVTATDDEPVGPLLERLAEEGSVTVAAAGLRSTELRRPFPSDEIDLDLPEAWGWVRAHNATRPGQTITYGILKPEWVDEGIPTVRVTEMRSGTIDLRSLPKCAPARAAKFEKTRLELNDLLVSKDAHARRLSDSVFRGAISADDIVDLHSHVPMYASFMTALQAFGWRDRLVSGAPGRDTIAMSIRRSSTVEASNLRKCPTCVIKDQAHYGCAHWRLFHQWPVARHCVVHGDDLVACCVVCKTPYVQGNEPSLADDPCRTCGSQITLAVDRYSAPAGYWPLLALLYRALQGQAPELSTLSCAHPLPRTLISRRTTTRLPMCDDTDLASLLAAWDVQSVFQISSLLGASWFRSDEPDGALPGMMSPPILQAAVFAAIPACR